MSKYHALRFVVHEHRASHYHFDFRLEIGGVLKSWAVPKGPSMNPRDKRLAVAVPDHPLEYADFEGIIPEGSYGAGEVVIWDAGKFIPFDDPEVELQQGRLEFLLEGKRLCGEFALVRFTGKRKQWLLMKKRDAYADPNWKTEPILAHSEHRVLRKKIRSSGHS
ncbi:MAG: DNA polymerase ligase N-terminal domain-containing protein [Chloroflexota bacterium]